MDQMDNELINNEIKKIATELNELASVVVIGEPSLDEFDRQLFELGALLFTATTIEPVEEAHRRYRRLQGSLSATRHSIHTWREKAEHFFYLLHQFSQNADVLAQQGKLMLALDDKVTQLLKIFSNHMQRTHQQEEKLLATYQQILTRKQELRPAFEKAKAPVLSVDEIDELVIGLS